MVPGSLKVLQLVVDDIEGRAHRGHDRTAFVDGKGDRWNSFVFFSDPDGNGWAIQERPNE